MTEIYSYQTYIKKLESNIHVSSFDDYVAVNGFRSNLREKKTISPKGSPNSMMNNFDDISYNLRSYIARSVK